MTAKELLEALGKTGSGNFYTAPVSDCVRDKGDQGTAEDALHYLREANARGGGLHRITLEKAEKLAAGHPPEHFQGKPPPMKGEMSADMKALVEQLKAQTEEQRQAREAQSVEAGRGGPPRKNPRPD